MENQHRKIAGYRELGQDEIDLINNVKSVEGMAAALVAKVKDLPESDKRAVALAVTNYQQASMWLTKAIGKSQNPFE